MNKSNVTELVFGCVVVQYWLVVLPPPAHCYREGLVQGDQPGLAVGQLDNKAYLSCC